MVVLAGVKLYFKAVFPIKLNEFTISSIANAPSSLGFLFVGGLNILERIFYLKPSHQSEAYNQFCIVMTLT